MASHGPTKGIYSHWPPFSPPAPPTGAVMAGPLSFPWGLPGEGTAVYKT